MNAQRSSEIQSSQTDLLGPDDFVPTLAELERAAIKKAMRLTHGDIRKAASMLGMGRATLYRKLSMMDAP